MNFNFDTGTISVLQYLDCTSLPALGGTAGVLTLVGTGGVILLQGTTAQRPTPDGTPAPAFAGTFRWNTTGMFLEYFDGLHWQTLSYAAGAVSSFNTTLSGLTPTSATTGAVTLAGTLGVASGGTGDTTLTMNGVLYGQGTSPVAVTAAGTQYQVLTVDVSGVPLFGAVNLASASAVTNNLSISNGGTGTSLSGSAGSIVYNNGTTLANGPVGTTGQLLVSGGAGAPTWINTTSDLTATGPNASAVLVGNGSGQFTAQGATYVGSPTYSGVTLQGTPTNATDAVTKQYVDSLEAGLSWKQAVRARTTVDLGTVTYANGTLGIGATLTNAGTQAALVLDGYTVLTGDRVLVANETNQAYNGIYTVTNPGSGSSNWVLTRSTDNNQSSEMDGAAVFVEEGTQYADTAFVQTAIQPIVIGTTNINWAQFSGSGTYTAGAGLTLTGTSFSANVDSITTYINGTNQIAVLSSSIVDQVLLSAGTGNTATWGALPLGNTSAVSGTLNIGNGGTGTSTAPSNGQILVGNGTTYTLTTLTQGTGITITNGVGTITIANAGVTSFQTSLSGLTPSTATSGAVTLAGTLGTSSGGTGANLTDVPGGIVYGGPTNMAFSSVGTTGYFLTSGGTGAPTWTNPATSLVTSIIAGTGISVSSATGAVTVSNTGVTNVSFNGVTTPDTNVFVYSPTANTAGNVGVTLSLQTQSANTVLAGPATGSAAQPTFRVLTSADMPANAGLQLYYENPSTPTAPTATGTNAVAIGNGANANATNSLGIGNGVDTMNYGAVNYASGDFATIGDAQGGFYVLRNQTTDATVTELFLDGTAATQRLIFKNNSVVTFDILVVGRRTDSSGGGAGYRFVGVIYKDTSSATNTFVGQVSKTIIGETNVPWDANCLASTINGNLEVTVTGEVSKTIRWVAVARTAEVTN